MVSTVFIFGSWMNRNTAQFDAPSILAGVADKLAKFKQPKQVVFVEALPRNAMGKVQKKDLRATYEDLFAA